MSAIKNVFSSLGSLSILSSGRWIDVTLAVAAAVGLFFAFNGAATAASPTVLGHAGCECDGCGVTCCVDGCDCGTANCCGLESCSAECAGCDCDGCGETCCVDGCDCGTADCCGLGSCSAECDGCNCDDCGVSCCVDGPCDCDTAACCTAC